MNTHDWVSREIDKLKQWVIQHVFTIARFSRIANSNASGEGDKIEGYADSDSQEVTRRMQSWGIRSVPPAGVDCIAVRVGGALGGVIVGTESKSYGPPDLLVGETALYNKVAGKVVKLDENGTLFLGAADATEFASLGTALDSALHNFLSDPPSLLLAAQNITFAGLDPILAVICTTAAANLVTAGSQIQSAIAIYEGVRSGNQNFQSSFVRVAK